MSRPKIRILPRLHVGAKVVGVLDGRGARWVVRVDGTDVAEVSGLIGDSLRQAKAIAARLNGGAL